MRYQLSIIVPCYNEAQNIQLVIEAFTKIVQQYNEVQVILVNNGSTDNTLQIANQTQLHNNISWVQVPINKGYGYGILQGLLQAQAPILSFTHADMQTSPDDVLRAYDEYKKNNDTNTLIKGIRRKRNRIDAFFTYLMQLYTNFKLKTALTDINAQPKLFSKQFFDTIKNDAPYDFSFDLYLLYFAQKKGTINTIDVVFAKRKFGQAKGGGSIKGKLKLMKRTLLFINQFAKKYV
jgi:glycosyltransferase involved in cell wall biosynthesis